MAVHSPNGIPGDGAAPSQLTGYRESAATTIGFERSSLESEMLGGGASSNPMLAVPTKRRGGLSSVMAIARRAPRMSAIWAIMKVAPVEKSGASEIAESSSASRSPVSCGLAPTASLSRLESLKSPLQISIFRPHPIQLVRRSGADVARA